MRKKILLIEDDADASMMLEKVLNKAGYEVQVFHEGKDIVEERFKLPDLFILDNSLPTIEGIALCKYLRLKPLTKKIPIIIISGSDHIEERSWMAGANHFLAKPLDVKQLLATIGLYLPVLMLSVADNNPTG